MPHSLPEHPWENSFDAICCPPDIQVVHARYLCCGKGVYKGGLTPARIGNEPLDRTELGFGSIDNFEDAFAVGHIARHRHCPTPGTFNSLNQGIQ